MLPSCSHMPPFDPELLANFPRLADQLAGRKRPHQLAGISIIMNLFGSFDNRTPLGQLPALVYVIRNFIKKRRRRSP